jgi:hypothetical protein
MILTVFATSRYPPLGWNSQVYSVELVFLALMLVLLALSFRLPQFIRALWVLTSGAALGLGAFLFLNGALDMHPPVEADALVSTKYVAHGKFTNNILVLNIAWNQGRIEQSLSVNSETFSAVEAGQSVHIIVYAGAFLIPWHGNGVDLYGL